MDNKTYEQVELHQDVLGNQRFFLLEDLECEVLFFNGRAMTVTLPAFVIKQITETEPGARGNTSTNVLKPAKIDTGFEVGVPDLHQPGRLHPHRHPHRQVRRARQAGLI